MSQADNLLDLFRAHGNRLTLGQILAAGPLIGSKYTNRIDDLRKRGYHIPPPVQDHEHPSNNVYTLQETTPPVLDGNQFAFNFIQPGMTDRP